MIIRLPRLQLGNFVTSGAKRLLQHNRHKADIPTAPAFVRYWATADNGGFWPATVSPLLTQQRHLLCTAAMVLMPVSAPIKVLV
jgi:hypothetical protein